MLHPLYVEFMSRNSFCTNRVRDIIGNHIYLVDKQQNLSPQPIWHASKTRIVDIKLIQPRNQILEGLDPKVEPWLDGDGCPNKQKKSS
jgi:hypothetical protein